MKLPQGLSLTVTVNGPVVNRSLSAARFVAADRGDPDALTSRLDIAFRYAGQDVPLGVFWFDADPTWIRRADGGWWIEGTMSDTATRFADPLPEAVSFPAGASVPAALSDVAELYGISTHPFQVDDTGATIGPAGLSFAAGEATGLDVLTVLVTLAGWWPVWVDPGTGLLVAREALPVGDWLPERALDGEVELGAAAITEPIGVPNRAIVAAAGVSDIPVVAVADLPDSSPYSAASRGRVITVKESVQGLSSVTAAMERAARILEDAVGAQQFQLVLAGKATPEVDPFRVFEYAGEAWVQTIASVGLAPAVQITRTLQHPVSAGAG
ncbi:MAG: hypothetical protein AAGA90_24180 [Actinomycetota bacterium]